MLVMAAVLPQPQPQPRKVPACKRELDHLVDIKIDDIEGVSDERRKQLLLREALKEWQEQVRALEGSVEKRTKRTDQLTIEIYQLVGLYSVFVGVVFTTVLQSSRVHCRHIWASGLAMTMKTKVVNKSGTALQLKEGNGGVYRNLTTLEKKVGTYTIKCNTNATYREYWVGTGLEDEDDTVLTITSDDCVEFQTVYIINDPDDHTKLKLDTVSRGVKETHVVNQSGADVKLVKKGGAESQVLKNGEKFVIKNGPKVAKDCNYSVEAGGETIPISTEAVAKAQRINISERDKTTGQAKLVMVPRRLYLTEVTNKTNTAILVKYHKGDGGSNADEVVKTLQADEKFTIQYDPKKGHNYWVENSSSAAGTAPTDEKLLITSTDFSEFERIDVIEGGSAGTKVLEKLEPRPAMATGKNSLLSRVLGLFGF